MPVAVVLTVLIQITLAVHAVRTGRGNWLFVILAFPLVGSAIYFFSEVLPDIQRGRTGRAAKETVLNTLDPTRKLKNSAKALKVSDNIDNRLQLADECVASGLYDDAIDYYQTALTGIYEHDPNIMLKLAQAYFFKSDFAHTQATLDALIAKNPDFKSQQGHLLYARSLEGLGEVDKALAEYATLTSYASGHEARCRYALLLKKQGQTEKARQLFQTILDRTEQIPHHLRKPHREWIDIARANL